MRARPEGLRVTIRKATPSHSVRDPGYKADCYSLDVSALTDILAIDTSARLVTAEGQVTMGDLAKATLAQGFVPQVVPEYRNFTVAGLINGEGIQSSSHRYGIFTRSLESVEVLLADGSIVTASTTSNPDLFAALPESLGTLGIVTAATIRLAPAKPYVMTTYSRFKTMAEYIKAFQETLGRHAFHEGVIFGPRTLVLITADFVDEPGKSALFDPERPGGEYFYQHVRRMAAEREETQEAIETLAYLSRSERGMWWMVECHTDFPLLSETEWGRRQMDESVKAVYNKHGFMTSDLSIEERNRCVISQDMGVRLDRLREANEWVQERLRVYPLWNCAVDLSKESRERLETSHLVDVGIYGEPKVRGYRHVRDMRALQKMVDAPSLWGVSYLTWDEIASKFPRRLELYERVRIETRAAEAFLHLREKVVWIDPGSAGAGKIPCWRLYRTYGKRWYLKPSVYLVFVVAVFSKLIWPRSPVAE